MNIEEFFKNVYNFIICMNTNIFEPLNGNVRIDAFVGMGAAINPAISNVTTFCLFAVAPFNLVKGVADSAITFLVYKQLSPILKADQMISSRKTVKAWIQEGE